MRSPRALVRYVYIYGHLVMVAGVVIAGVGAEHVIIEADNETLSLSTRLALCGGVILFLSAITVIRLAVGICRMVLTRYFGIAAVLGLIFIGGWLAPLVLVSALVTLLVAEVWLEANFQPFAEDEGIKETLTPLCTHLGMMQEVEPSSKGCEDCLRACLEIKDIARETRSRRER